MFKRPARFCGRLVAQRGMRPDVVVVVAPQGQRAAGIGQAVEDLLVEALVAQAAVESEEGSANSPGDCWPRRKM